MSKKTNTIYTSEKDRNQPSFQEDISLFTSSVESLRVTFPLVTQTISVSQEEASKKVNDFMHLLLKKSRAEGNDKSQFTPYTEEMRQFFKLARTQSNFKIASSILEKSFIVSLISQFDVHLSRLIRTMFYIKPEKLNSSEKTLTFAKLIEFNTIEAAREYVIEKEVETVLRKSHSEQFKWLEEKLSIKTLRDLPAWSSFIEVTERRNLFVHCDGIISSQYIDVCQQNKVVLDKECDLGNKLGVDNIYFEDACKCILEVGIKLAHVMWRKLQQSERKNADNSLNNTCVELITNEEYDLANILLDFALTDPIKKDSTQEIKLMFLINKAQALKWKGNESEARRILDIDWSACANEFRLARAVLLDKFEEAAKIMLRIGRDEKAIAKIHYKEWPLFKEFKKSDVFLEAYAEIFEEPFSEESLSMIEPFSKIEETTQNKKNVDNN
jgi:hypothetical protein